MEFEWCRSSLSCFYGLGDVANEKYDDVSLVMVFVKIELVNRFRIKIFNIFIVNLKNYDLRKWAFS